MKKIRLVLMILVMSGVNMSHSITADDCVALIWQCKSSMMTIASAFSLESNPDKKRAAAEAFIANWLVEENAGKLLMDALDSAKKDVVAAMTIVESDYVFEQFKPSNDDIEDYLHANNIVATTVESDSAIRKHVSTLLACDRVDGVLSTYLLEGIRLVQKQELFSVLVNQGDMKITLDILREKMNSFTSDINNWMQRIVDESVDGGKIDGNKLLRVITRYGREVQMTSAEYNNALSEPIKLAAVYRYR